MQQIPKVLAAARANLANPSRVFLETAIRQNRGAIGFYEKDVFDLAGKTPQATALKAAAGEVVTALKVHQDFLEKELLPRANGEWRIGRDKFYRKLELQLDAGLNADQVLADAEAEFDRVTRERRRMRATSGGSSTSNPMDMAAGPIIGQHRAAAGDTSTDPADGGAGGIDTMGWQKFTSEGAYLGDLQAYDAELQKDDYMIGATIFQAGSGWASWDVSNARTIPAWIGSTGCSSNGIGVLRAFGGTSWTT